MSVHPLVNVLRRERERRQITQQQIADRTGWHSRTVRAAETGRCSPTLAFVEDYANSLDLAVAIVGRHGREIVEVPPRLASRQVCPGCGNEYQVTRKGVIRKHGCSVKEER